MQVLRDGAALIIFPEAEREFSDGKMMPFKSGAVRLAMDAEVPILPVTIIGGNKVWAQDLRIPRFGKVEIIYHPIIKIVKPEIATDLRIYIEEQNSKLARIISMQ